MRTSISENAMTGTGKKFSKLDGNIAKGIPVDKASSIILKAITQGTNELTIGSLYYKIVPVFLAICP